MCNMGKLDRIFRLILGIALIAWGFMAENWIGAIGIIPLGTALIGFCPLYKVIGMDTGCKTDTPSDTTEP